MTEPGPPDAGRRTSATSAVGTTLDNMSSTNELDWSFGTYQKEDFTERFKKLQVEMRESVYTVCWTEDDRDEATQKPPQNIGSGLVDAKLLGLERVEDNISIKPDGYTGSDAGDMPKKATNFDVSNYRRYQKLLAEMEEGTYYEEYLAGKQTLTVDDLTWERLLKEFTNKHGPSKKCYGCPSIGLIAENLEDYKKFRIDQLKRWHNNIQKHGERIFSEDSHDDPEQIVRRPSEVEKLIKSSFRPWQLKSFDMNPSTHPAGCDYLCIPRPTLDLSSIHIVLIERMSKKRQFRSSYSTRSDVLDETRLCRQLTNLATFDPQFNIPLSLETPERCGKTMATTITEFLLQYPLGIHYSKFLERFRKHIGYKPNFREIGFSEYPALMWIEKDIFWTPNSSRELPGTSEDGCPLDIFFPACLKDMIEDLLQIIYRLWHKYRHMVGLEGQPLPFTETTWSKFESVLSMGITSVENQDRICHVFHYSDWNFKTHEDFVQFCLKKWQNPGFHILKAGTVIAGLGDRVWERSIYYGPRGSILEPENNTP